MSEPIEFVKKVVEISNDFELNTSELKRQYIISNIVLYNNIASLIKESLGTFGTGYPFYVFDKNFVGAIPVIDEQIRYNNELIDSVNATKFTEWACAVCLEKNGITMPDLKQICNTCPKMDNLLKPRKLIARLPDIDMWMVCNSSDISHVSKTLETALAQNGMKTSDVDPVKTIYELQEIVSDLKHGDMPKLKLPIDTHIIDNVTLYTLISKIPQELHDCFKAGKTPYLPILPLSLRKTWQHDDAAYNFVYDYLSSFAEFQMDDKIQELLDETRREVAKRYSLDVLYDFMIKSGPPMVARRNETPGLKKTFERRIESWKEL